MIYNKNDVGYIDFEDIVSLTELTEHFKKFKAHNFQTSRHIHKWIAKNNNFKYKGRKIVDFYSPYKQLRLQNCNSWGEYVKFTDGKKEIKQKKSNACNNALLCPFCASR